MAEPTQRQLAAQDFSIGDLVAQRTVVFDEHAFSAFAAITGDNHPIHYDRAYAADKGLRAPIAHGLLLLSMSALGATALSPSLRDSMVAMVGVQADFLAPVFLDDVIDIRFEVGAIVPKPGNRSLVRFDALLFESAMTAGPADKPQAKLVCRSQLHFLLKTSLRN